MITSKLFNVDKYEYPLSEESLNKAIHKEIESDSEHSLTDDLTQEIRTDQLSLLSISSVESDWISNIHSIFSKSQEEQRSFFLSQTPQKWYPLNRVRRKIWLCLSGGAGKEDNIIYIFHNKILDKYLIGKTEQTFRKRMSRYRTAFNGKESIGSEFISDVKSEPSNFQVGILYRLKPTEDIDLIEDGFIQHYLKEGKLLYNKKKGGGGGRARLAELPSCYAIPVREGFLSPEKNYRVIRGKSGVSLDVSPGFYKSIQSGRSHARQEGRVFGHVYRYKRVNNATVTRYIGMSGVAEERVPKHCWDAKRRLNSTFYQDLETYPEQFEANILPVEFIDPNHLTAKERANFVFFEKLGEVEDYFIDQAKGDGLVYNESKGGGGPRARSLCQLLEFQL
ncbi:MAG: hypothetical protein ACHQUC_04535 [Chlamydiales bacterium]